MMTESKPEYSKDIYEQLERGMPVEDVARLLGDGYEVISDHDSLIEPGLQIGSMDTQVVEWRDDAGHAIRVMFGNGELREKSSPAFD